MGVSLEQVSAMYTNELLSNYTKLRYSVITFSPCNFIGSCVAKLKNGVVEGVSITELDYGLCVQRESNSPTFVPTKTDDPSKYLSTLVKLIAKYGMVSNVPDHFAKHLIKLGYRTKQRPWGNHDYVIDNTTLMTLAGRKFERDRNYHKRICKVVDFNPITKEDYAEALAFEELWRANFTRRNPGVGIGKIGYLSNAIKYMDYIPDTTRTKFIGARLKATGKLVMVGSGELCSSTVWGNSFRYVDTDLMPNGATSCLHLLSQEFADTSYEIDGDGGGAATTGLCQFKEHFITKSVASKQLHFFLVGK